MRLQVASLGFDIGLQLVYRLPELRLRRLASFLRRGKLLGVGALRLVQLRMKNIIVLT